MKIEQVGKTILEMPYKKRLVTATNNFTVARGLIASAVFLRRAIRYGGKDYEG